MALQLKRFGLLASLLLALPVAAQTQNAPVTTTWPNGDSFSGPAYDGDLEHIGYGIWKFADGSSLSVDANGTLNKNEKGEPVADGEFMPSRGLIVPLISAKADWPDGAQARGEAGMTIIAFVIGLKGMVIDPRVVQSSGYDDLDQQAVKLLAKKIFNTSMQGKTRVKSSSYQSYRWQADLTAMARIPRVAKPTNTPLNMSGNSIAWMHASNTDCWIRSPFASKPATLSVSWTGGCTGNIANGRGSVIWKTDTHYVETYTGDVKDGFYNGRGSWRYEDGSHYDGDFVNNLHTGTGIFTNAENVRYDGGFKEDAFDGPGRLRLGGGPLIEGVFVNDNLTSGTETFGSGLKYEGTFVNFQAAGKGKLQYGNGEWFEGELAASAQPFGPLLVVAPTPGKGQYHHPNGIVDDGIKKGDVFTGARILPDGTRLENFVSAHHDSKAAIRKLQANGFVTAEIEFTVGANAKIHDVKIIKSSGDSVTDHRIVTFKRQIAVSAVPGRNKSPGQPEAILADYHQTRWSGVSHKPGRWQRGRVSHSRPTPRVRNSCRRGRRTLGGRRAIAWP